MNKSEKIQEYLDKISQLNSDKMMDLVSNHIDDEAIELICDHIEDFYGIESDDDIGMLAQIMVAGYVMACEINK